MANIRSMNGGHWLWIGKQILEDKRVSSADVAVYVALASFADNKTQTCRISIRRLAQRAKRSKNTVEVSLGHLESAGYIKSYKNHRTSTKYTLLEVGADHIGEISDRELTIIIKAFGGHIIVDAPAETISPQKNVKVLTQKEVEFERWIAVNDRGMPKETCPKCGNNQITLSRGICPTCGLKLTIPCQLCEGRIRLTKGNRCRGCGWSADKDPKVYYIDHVLKDPEILSKLGSKKWDLDVKYGTTSTSVLAGMEGIPMASGVIPPNF